jgi:N utilization substance protein B
MIHKNRQARIFALKFLFQLHFHPKSQWSDIQRLSKQNFTLEGQQIGSDDTLIFANHLIEGVILNWDELHGIMEQYLTKGKNNLSFIDRTLLLLSIFEMEFFKLTPKNVVINETIELGKQFSTAESGGLINGVLDKVAQNYSLKKEIIPLVLEPQPAF